MIFTFFVISAFALAAFEQSNACAQTDERACALAGAECEAACTTFCNTHPHHTVCPACTDGTTALACASTTPRCYAKCLTLCAAVDGTPPAECTACDDGDGTTCTPTATSAMCTLTCAATCVTDVTPAADCTLSKCTLLATDPLVGLETTAECKAKHDIYCGLHPDHIACSTCGATDALSCADPNPACIPKCAAYCDGKDPATITTCKACAPQSPGDYDVCTPGSGKVDRCGQDCALACLQTVPPTKGCPSKCALKGDDIKAHFSTETECATEQPQFCLEHPHHTACVCGVEGADACKSALPGCLTECARYCANSGSGDATNCAICTPQTPGSFDLCTPGTGDKPRCDQDCGKACLLGKITGATCPATYCTLASTDLALGIDFTPECAAERVVFCTAHPGHNLCAACPNADATDIAKACASPIVACATACENLCKATPTDPACAACTYTSPATACSSGSTAAKCKVECTASCTLPAGSGTGKAPTECATRTNCSVGAVAGACATGVVTDCKAECDAFCATTPCDAAHKPTCGTECTAWCEVEENKESEDCPAPEDDGAFSIFFSLLILIISLL